MLRGFTPFFLATLGLILFVPSVIMPLFEWQISEAVVGASSACDDNLPSSLTTTIGEPLDQRNDPFLLKRARFFVRSSQSGRIIERITRNINEDSLPFFWLFLLLCGIYTCWYAIYNKRTIAEVLVSPLVAMLLLCILINAGRLVLPHIGGLWCLQGVFNAELSKIHYETLLIWLAALFAETGAIVVMLYQIIKAIMRRKEPAQSIVG